jgi:hypothetical protein
MKYVVGPVEIAAPDDLVDQTSYVFEDRAAAPTPGEDERSPDRITVGREVMPPDVTPDDMVAHQRDRIAMFPDITVQMTEGEIQGARVLAKTLHVDAQSEDENFEIYFAAFRWPPSLIVSIDFETRGRRGADVIFRHAVESVREAPSAPSAAPAAPGYAVRFAGDIALDLPSSFGWPRVYLFTSPDEDTRVLIETGEAEPAAVEFESLVELEGGGDRLHVDERRRDARTLPSGIRGREGQWSVERRSAADAVIEARAVRRFVADLGDRGFISILVIEAGAPYFDDGRWNDLLESIELSSQVP